jgi:cytochrome d ubiquinol oxidase subunit II
VTLIIAVIVGAMILFPSLALLFRLFLHGQLDEGSPTGTPPTATTVLAVSAHRVYTRLSAAGLLAGFGFLTVADAPWAHGIGVACLFGFILFGFVAFAPAQTAEQGASS